MGSRRIRPRITTAAPGADANLFFHQDACNLLRHAGIRLIGFKLARDAGRSAASLSLPRLDLLHHPLPTLDNPPRG